MDSTKIIFYISSVVNTFSIFSFNPNKKHISIAYHFLRWHVAAVVIKVAWIDTNANLADAMTKILTLERRENLFGQWTY